MVEGEGGEGRGASVERNSPPSVTLVIIGDEILAGHRADLNGPWLARRLSELGFSVASIVAVGDDEERISEALSDAVARTELVIATGGLGPTRDDRTREAVAETWSLRLVEDRTVLDEIRARFRSRGYHDAPRESLRMARIPEGATVLPNPRGVAPGLRLDIGPPEGGGTKSMLVLLPGIPYEVRALTDAVLEDQLRAAFRSRLDPAVMETVHTTGLPESTLAGRVEAVLGEADEVRVAYRPSLHGVTLRLSARGTDAALRLARARKEVHSVLAPYLFEAADGDLSHAVGLALTRAGLRIGVAESCTGGLMMKRLTDVPGSSGWTVGGVVAYADRIKEGWLGVPGSVLAAQGAVSEPVARAMAEAIRRRFGVEVGVGITGIAGPGGGVEGKPVGTVWFGIAGPRGTHAEKVRFPGGRTEVRERAVQHALHLVLRSVDAPGRSGRIETNPSPGGG